MRDRETEEGGAEVEVEREESGDEGKREKDGGMDNCERE